MRDSRKRLLLRQLHKVCLAALAAEACAGVTCVTTYLRFLADAAVGLPDWLAAAPTAPTAPPAVQQKPQQRQKPARKVRRVEYEGGGGVHGYRSRSLDAAAKCGIDFRLKTVHESHTI